MRYLIQHSRSSVRYLGFAFLVALALAAVTLAPRLAAQAPVPAANSASTPAAPAAQSGKAGGLDSAVESEAEENNVYRHAPVVQTMARMLHLRLETTARIFEAINFTIIALLIIIPLSRFLPKIMRKRAQTLQHSIEAARKVTEDANSRLSAVEARLSKLDEEIAQIRAHVEEESKQDEVRIKAAIEDESARIVAAAEQEISVAAAHAKRGLRHFAADLAIEQASKQMVLTPETDRKLIDEFVRDVAKGGKN